MESKTVCGGYHDDTGIIYTKIRNLSCVLGLVGTDEIDGRDVPKLRDCSFSSIESAKEILNGG